jgi:hypothetical protein
MEKNSFDAVAYFSNIAAHNVLAATGGFLTVVISDSDSLEGLLDRFTESSRFIAVSDTNTGSLTGHDGVGYFKRRVYTVFVLASYTIDDMTSRQASLDLCRELFHQIVSRILMDKYSDNDFLRYLDVDNIPNQEIGRYYLSGLTGLFFTISVSEPIDLVYNADQWT